MHNFDKPPEVQPAEETPELTEVPSTPEKGPAPSVIQEGYKPDMEQPTSTDSDENVDLPPYIEDVPDKKNPAVYH